MASDRSPGDLFERLRNGDRAAFEELTSTVRPRLHALIQSRLGERLRQRIDLEDILQETLLRAYRSIGRFQSNDVESLIRWLGTIANHVVLESARQKKQEVFALDADPSDTATEDPALASSLVTPSQAEVRKERFARLEEALRELSPDHREVILLARVDKLPIAEVARRLQRSPAAASQLLWRALGKLKDLYGSVASDDSFRLPPASLRHSKDAEETDHDGEP